MYHAHCSILSLSLFNSTHPPVLFALLLVFSSSRFLEGYQTFHLTFLCCCPRCVKLQSFIQTQSDIRLERIASVRRRRLAQFSSVQFKMVSRRSEKPICAPPHLSEVSQCCLWNGSNVRLIDDGPLPSFPGSLFQRLSPPGDRWCDVIGFFPQIVGSGQVVGNWRLALCKNNDWRLALYKNNQPVMRARLLSSGAVWKSRWPSWAPPSLVNQ